MSLGTKACAVFCGLNGVCAFVIAYCFKVEIGSMAITVAERGWNNPQKIQALRNAGIVYFVIAVFLMVRSMLIDRRLAKEEQVSRAARLQEYELGANTQGETQPLLGKSEEYSVPRSTSYGSQTARE